MTARPTILILGRDGQVGRELVRALAPLGDLIACGRAEADLGRPDTLRDRIASVAPDVIVNAAAYTAVDRAETEPELCRRINTEAVATIAAEARRRGALLVHYSTDYVFDGTRAGWYAETDEPRPLGVYGATKLEGERAAATAGRHLVFRTSWVSAGHGRNFVRTILRVAREREWLDVVDDQWGAPTAAGWLADVTARAIARGLVAETALSAGVYHVVPGGETTWCRFARFILTEARRLGLAAVAGPEQVRAIPTSQYPTPARRPANSRLATDKIRAALGGELPAWQDAVGPVVAALVADLLRNPPPPARTGP
ncbi:MAG: dTDP-4-dehydrorhamnose reductase [Planctomycetia bacterium]